MPPYVPPDPVEADARRQIYVTAAFLLAAFVLASIPKAAQETLASSLRASLLRPFLGVQEMVAAARQRTLDVEVLQARLDSATARLASRATLEEENRRLRSLLDLGARAEREWRAAQVLRPGTEGSESMFLVNLGADDGVPPRAPVVTREGLGGVIREVRPGNSIGMDWTSPDFAASAMSRDGAVYGIVETRRGLFREEDRLMLTGTPYHTRLEPGTEIVTSGIGGVFPRGIPVGRVVEVAESEGGWITSYWVEPYVRPGDMVQVLILIPGAVADTLAADGLEAMWPEGSTGTRPELWAREQARADSLVRLREQIRAVEDSLRLLRGRAASPDTARGGEAT